MMKDQGIFRAIAKAISKFNPNLKLMILSSSKNNKYQAIAKKYNIKLLYEVFADRAYTDEGFLVSRTEKNATIEDKEEVLKRAKLLMKKGILTSINGKRIKLKVDALCVHGDNKSALKLIKSLHKLKNDL